MNTQTNQIDVHEIAADAHEAADKLHAENKPIALKQHNCQIFSRGFEFLSLDANGERDEELVDYCDREEMSGEVVEGMIKYARNCGSAYLAIGYGIDAAESQKWYDYGDYEPMFDWVDLPNIDIRTNCETCGAAPGETHPPACADHIEEHGS